MKLFGKRNRSSNTRSDEDITRVNPAGLSEEIGSQPMKYIDDLAQPDPLTKGARTREEARAINLGRATGDQYFSEALKTDVRPALDEHTGLEAELEALEPRRIKDLEAHQQVVDDEMTLARVPLGSRDPQHKKISWALKAFLVIGDTGLVAVQQWRVGGAPLWLSILTGVSLGGSVVAVGTMLGHEIGVSNLRRKRGQAPEDAPQINIAHYDDGGADQRYQLWLRFAGIAAGVMFLSLFMLGRGAGDSALLAFGFGSLASVTVLGSAGAEAFATNDVTDALEGKGRTRRSLEDRLQIFEKMENRSATCGAHASVSEQAAIYGAQAAAITATCMASRLEDTPEIGGYEDFGHIPVAKTTPETATERIAAMPALSGRRRNPVGQGWAASNSDNESGAKTIPFDSKKGTQDGQERDAS